MVFGDDGELLVQSGIAAVGAAMMVAGDGTLVVAGGTFRDDGDSFDDAFEDTFRATMLVTGVEDGDAAVDAFRATMLVAGVDDGDALI